MEFADRIVAITGSASGIGEGLAEKFAALGMKLVLADVDGGRLRDQAAAFRASGTEVIALHTDVSDPAALETLADAAYDRFGAVHLLCNNAGIVPAGRERHIWDIPAEDWQWTLGVNLLGVINGIRSFVPRMLAAGTEGHIVNTVSVSGLISGASSPVYGVSKHGALRATEALYASLRDIGAPIGVTALCPGVVHTAIHRSERSRPAALVPQSGVARERSELEAWYATMQQHGLTPAAVADMVVDAIERKQFYLITTDAFDSAIRDRAEAILSRGNPGFEDHVALSQRDIDLRRLGRN